ncbi:MAG TPA: DUF4387 family protein [Kribbella sp.]|jgi:hypothetical protein
MADHLPAHSTLGEHAREIRSKNAAPFRMTLEAFMKDDAGYRLAADLIDETTAATLYAVPAKSVLIFPIAALNVVKISFPRPVAHGGLRDRDIHAGQHHVPLANLPVGDARRPAREVRPAHR